MLSVIEAERYFEEKSCKSDPLHSKNKIKKRVCEEDQSYITSGDSHQVGYRDIHSKYSCKNVSRNKDEHHHPRHQAQPCSTLSNENLLHSTQDKLGMESDTCPPKDLNRRYRKKKLQVSDVVDSLDSGENERTDCDSESSFALNNICNNSNGGISCWDEVRKSICPEEAKIVPSAAFLEHDIISKQRKEILLLMEELSTRDQELNDLVRSHQSQVKAWETDRNKLKELQDSLCNYEKELQRSDQHLQLTLDEMKKVTDQKEIDGMELKKTKGEMEKLSKKIQENSFYLKEMEVQNKNLMESVKKLVNNKEDLEMRGKDLSSRLKTKAGELNVQASEITRLTAQNNSLESKLSNANENIRNLKAESVAWKNRYCTAKDEMDRLTEDNALKDGHIQNLTTQLHETLQQTLALQKALFTSCEREKCKEEIMHSLRKQQKRSMQEMSSLRKLYERQTKDLTLYHLSVQGANGGSGHAGQGEVKEVAAKGTDKKPHGQSGQGEGKVSKKGQEQVQTHTNGRGRHTERKHKNDGWSNKNMSYNTLKPNFLRHESREESSSFLLKKKICCSDGQSSQESDYDERKDFIYSVNSEYEESDMGNNKDCPCDASPRRDKTEKEGSNDPMDKKEKGNESLEKKDISSLRPRNVSRHNTKMEKTKRRSKSLGIEDKGKLNNNALHRPKSCSRGTSPLNIQDKATSPITNFYTAHENTASLYSDANTFSDDKNNGKSTNRKVDNVPNEKKMTDTKQFDEEYKESPKKDTVRSLWSAVKQKKHNETSGVCLSSSDCSSSSTVSSPGRERAFDELTPADSDGMCNELQRKYIPDQHEPSQAFHDGLDSKAACIHLKNSPTVIPEAQNNSSRMSTRTFSNQRDSDNGCVPKRNMFVGRSFRLVDEKQNEDTTINKEKWSDNSEIMNSSIGMCAGIDQTKNGTGSYTLHRNDRRIDLSGDSFVMNRRNCEISNPQASNSKDHKIPCENNNGHKIVKGSYDNNDSNRLSGTGTLLFSKNLTDNNSRFQQPRHSSSHFPNSAREKESLGMDNQASILDRRRLASAGRCVRVVSPHQDDINTRCAFSDLRRKDANNHLNSHSDSSPFDSDQSEISMFSVSTKSNRSSIKEKLNNIFARSAISKSADSSRSHPNSPQQKEEADSKMMEDNKGGANASGVNSKQNYFYEENLSSDSDHGRLRARNRTFENKIAGNNAYIVPVSSSICSRPFMSTKGPSLYNQLSTIHYSEKSRRFEWVGQGTSQESEGKENHQGSHQQRKPPFITFPNSETIDKRTESDKDASRGNCSNNNNNNNSEPFEKEDATIDDIFENSSPYANSVVIHSLNPNSNMDKFHHHYNNIVRKLTVSNIIIDIDENNLENSIYTHQSNFPFNPTTPKRINKKTEFSNVKSDESIFSPSQICAKDSISENKYAVDDNVVRQLDFSNSTCVDQSNSDTGSVCSSHFLNILGFNSEYKSVAKPEDKDSRRMNIPLDCPERTSDNPYLHNTRHRVYIHDMDSENKHLNLNETSEANEVFQNASLQSNKPFWNVCDHGEQTKFDKDKILSSVDEKCKTSENNSVYGIGPLDKQQENEEDFDFVAHLPDYFPDISSVIADDDSVNPDEEGERTDCSEFNEFISKNPGEKTGVTQEDDGYNMTRESINKQPYSHTSTPTKLKTRPSVINCHTTNDLNFPHREKDGQSVEEKTLVSKESEFFGVKCLSGIDVDVEHSNDTISSAIEDDGDRRKKNTDHAQIYKAEKNIGHIIDSNSIIISMKETEDINKSDIDPVHLNKSCDKLCSPRNNIDEYKDQNVITKDGTTLKPLKINCNGDTNSLQRDDSSYLEGPWDKFEDRLSNFLSDTPRQVTSDDHFTVMTVPMSPASKLHHLLLESQEMIRSLEKRNPLL